MSEKEAPAPANPLRRSKTSGLWGAVIALAIGLILLIIFIAQNTQQIDVHYFGWTARTSAAIALIIAATGGIVVTTVAGTVRILQLRRHVRSGVKNGKRD